MILDLPPLANAAERIASAGGILSDTEGSGEPARKTTGFCTDLWWAQVPRLSICVCFRDDGPYRVRNTHIGCPNSQ